MNNPKYLNLGLLIIPKLLKMVGDFLVVLFLLVLFHFLFIINRLNVMGGLVVVRLVEIGITAEAYGTGLLTFFTAFGVEPLIIFVLFFRCARRVDCFLDDCGHSVLS